LSYLTLNNIVSLKSGLQITEDHSNWYHLKAWVRAVSYSPSIVTGCIVHDFRHKARYWSKIVIFSYPVAIDVPVRGSPSEYCHPVWYGQTRMIWLPDSEKTLMICLAVSTEYRRVTDRRTDRRADILPRHSPRYAYASRGKNPQKTDSAIW